MKVLVDTHAFLWGLIYDPRLSHKAREVLTAEMFQPVFSLVSLWEIAIKINKGKLNITVPSVASVRSEMESYGMELLPIRYEHVLRLESLPSTTHADPFDRLLIAQALSENIPILTGDRAFRQYGVKTMW